MRKQGVSRNTITATPRQLESLIRLSEALAKMELKDKVTAEHV
jgi:DNA replication licensing factor MCM4